MKKKYNRKIIIMSSMVIFIIAVITYVLFSEYTITVHHHHLEYEKPNGEWALVEYEYVKEKIEEYGGKYDREIYMISLQRQSKFSMSYYNYLRMKYQEKELREIWISIAP